MSDNTPKMDGINTDQSTTTETINTSTAAETKADIKKKSKKGFVYTAITLGVILLLILGATFIKFGTQSIVARALDATGQHQTAFGLDLINTQGFGTMSKAGAVDISKPETCKNVWDISSFKSTDYSAIAGSTNFKIEPNNSTFKSNFSYEGYLKGNLNLNDAAADIFTDQKLVLDADLIQKGLGTAGAKSYGVVTLAGKGELLTSARDAGYINLLNLALNTKDFNVNGGLNGWYKQDFALTDDQKAGVSDITDVIKKNISVRPDSVLSADSLQAIYTYYCSGLEKVEFGAPKSMTFGTGDYTKTKYVRPLSIILKPDANKIYLDKLPDLVDKIGKDITFRNYVKSRYDDYLKYGYGVMKLSGNMSDSKPPSKADFDKQIDQLFDKELTKEAVIDSLNKSGIQATEEMFTSSNKAMEVYLAMDTLEPYALNSIQSVVPTPKYLEATGLKTDNQLYGLIKDGFTFSAQYYDMAIGNKTPKIETPTQAKPFSEFGRDLGQTPAAQTIQQEIQKQAPEPSPYDIQGDPNSGRMYDPSLPTEPTPVNPNGKDNSVFLPQTPVINNSESL